MSTFKLVISDPKEKKAYQVEVDKGSSALVGKKIGDKFDGSIAKLIGYKLQITGGSDQQGFPMRNDVEGSGRKRLLLAFGPGFHPLMKGQRKRKSIRGNTVSLEMAQINAKVVEYGKDPMAKLLGKEKPAEEKPAEAKKEHADKPAVEKAAEPKHEKKPEHHEKPAEAKKEHVEAKETPKENKPIETKQTPSEKPKEE